MTLHTFESIISTCRSYLPQRPMRIEVGQCRKSKARTATSGERLQDEEARIEVIDLVNVLLETSFDVEE